MGSSRDGMGVPPSSDKSELLAAGLWLGGPRAVSPVLA